MSQIIPLYSKYKDAQNRLYVVIERYGAIDESHKVTEPELFKVLNVGTEKAENVEAERFFNSINTGKLIKVA